MTTAVVVVKSRRSFLVGYLGGRKARKSSTGRKKISVARIHGGGFDDDNEQVGLELFARE